MMECLIVKFAMTFLGTICFDVTDLVDARGVELYYN